MDLAVLLDFSVEETASVGWDSNAVDHVKSLKPGQTLVGNTDTPNAKVSLQKLTRFWQKAYRTNIGHSDAFWQNGEYGMQCIKAGIARRWNLAFIDRSVRPNEPWLVNPVPPLLFFDVMGPRLDDMQEASRRVHEHKDQTEKKEGPNVRNASSIRLGATEDTALPHAPSGKWLPLSQVL